MHAQVSNMQLTVDRREKALCAAMDGKIQFGIRSLPLGDLMCTYDDGSTWIMERKTSQDLANSIKTGRWGEQSRRLDDASCKIFFIIEGDLRDTGMPDNSLISSLLNAELRKNTHVIRTMDVNETAHFIKHLCQKCEGALPTGVATTITTKRKRDAEPDLVFKRQLMCIPSMSENVANKLREQFGTITRLQEGLKNKAKFPKVVLDSKQNLGKKRIEILCKYML
jgi:ERCC4-type nuclease